MDYNYEALSDQRFQKLAQALIVAQYQNTQCLPVGQPDGGRDALLFIDEVSHDNFVAFQVKFSLDPKTKTERDVIEALIKSEEEKVKKLIQRGATCYHLVTNVQGTSHLDGGSIDKTNKVLSDAFDIPTYVWWRDDLDRRLDSANDIKWSYPEILKATDILPVLLLLIQRPEDHQAARAFQSYMATQYENDKEVKFKQVDLQRKLTDLFVDLPLGHKRQRTEQNTPVDMDDDDIEEKLGDYINQLNSEFERDNPFDHSGLAAAFLLQMPPQKGVSRLVVEGAPGQGKSTVTQFLCQVNRLRLLQKNNELKRIDSLHKPALVRMPFRIDLRDYAAWVSEQVSSANTVTPTQESSHLESFLVREVERRSGGLSITTDELLRFFASSYSVIVLDGFDEVADIAIRKRIVAEIREAASRLDIHAESMQIIVTSRPAVFANSPGFPEDEWIHLELKDLRRDNIARYKEKWIKAQGLNEEESDQVSSTLDEKLNQPHLRDLARNPMQLAILLHLIHVLGAALPEKRTTLYEEYMKLFFNREAEKSAVVRDHRELLLAIHGVLAWVLHTQAEDGAGTGSITRAALRDEMKTYLETQGHKPHLAEELLTGSVERVGALVSRVEGTFEFEVQPLREYFAAQHLYRTAHYSPVGQVRKGTRPERFQAIARSSYWTNVTRFFCGFYDVGELSSLVDGLTDLGEKGCYSLINQPRQLAMMLLSDRVFTQAPKARDRLIRFIVEEPGFERLTSTMGPHPRRGMSLPAEAGGDYLFELCRKKLEKENDPSWCGALRGVMAENDEQKTLKPLWISRFSEGSMKGDPLREAMDFGIVDDFTPQEIAGWAKDNMDFHLRWLNLANHYETVVEDPSLYEAAKKAFFDGDLEFPFRWPHPADSVTALEALTELLRPYALVELFSDAETTTAAHAILSRGYTPGRDQLLERVRKQYDKDGADSLESFALFLINLLNKGVAEWQQSLTPWAALVDRGLDEAPGSDLMAQTAMIAAASRAQATVGVWDESRFTVTKGLVHRLFFARHKAEDANWWRARLTAITTETAIQYLTVLLSWGAPDVIAVLKAEIDSATQELSSRDRDRLWSMTNLISWNAREYRIAIPEHWFQTVEPLSPCLASILIGRCDDREVERRVSRDYFRDYEGNDEHILRHATQLELFVEREKDSVDWDYVLHLSQQARRIGVPFLSLIPRSLSSEVPEAAAKAVLSSCKEYDEKLVAMCEHTYSMTVAQATSKVLHVAQADNWFVPFD